MFLPRRAIVSLAVALPGFACHRGSSGDEVPASTRTSNLGLAVGAVYGSGRYRLLLVTESEQGRDLDGDGDLFDSVVHVLDLELGSVVETGLVLGIVPSSGIEVPARPVVSAEATIAFAVSESETGGLDRNADGDTDDLVLALYEPDGASVTNLGLAASFVTATRTFLAFTVPEVSQGADLDGDGSVSAADHVLFVHDLARGETWNTGLVPARVLGAQGDFVALAVGEEAGDGNGDGDTFDFLFELYDVRTRSVQHTALALQSGITGPVPPVARHDRWAFNLYEGDQGMDLNGDGDTLDLAAIVYDPGSRTYRALGPLVVAQRPELDPLVLFELPQPGAPGAFSFVWLYDVRTDLLVSTGFAGSDVQRAGERLVISVDEQSQGQDLDQNGFLDGIVPVLFELASGRSEVLPLDGVAVRPTESGLLVRARESFSRRDWNGDGDQNDLVLFTWDERDGRLVNTRLAPANAAFLGEGLALLEMDETALSRDLNGDGDEEDFVVHVYDLRERRLTNLRLATLYLLETASDGALCGVNESRQGADLNGDGDLSDIVLHLTKVNFFALHGEGG